jgi:hypothetical protein
MLLMPFIYSPLGDFRTFELVVQIAFFPLSWSPGSRCGSRRNYGSSSPKEGRVEPVPLPLCAGGGMRDTAYELPGGFGKGLRATSLEPKPDYKMWR